jgi:hypothetical protein
MATNTPKIKHRARVKLIDAAGKIVQDNEDASTYLQSYGAYRCACSRSERVFLRRNEHDQ